MSHIAKLFSNGRSQAVRLPAAYRFEGTEVHVRRDMVTGDVILSRRPPSLKRFFELLQAVDVPDDFLSFKSKQYSVKGRNPFAQHKA